MKKAVLTIVAMFACVMVSQAQVLSWDVTGNGSPVDPTLPADAIDPNLDTTSGLNTLSRTTVIGASAANSFNSNNWNTTDTRVDSTNYIGFSLSPSAGFIATLTSLDYAINGSNTAPGTGQWGYSIDGGAFVLQSSFSLTNPQQVSLSTWDFSDFTITESQSVEFRFWAFGIDPIGTGAASTSSGTVRINNITGNDLVLNGSVVVPEPATIGLIGFGLLSTWAFARRRSRK